MSLFVGLCACLWLLLVHYVCLMVCFFEAVCFCFRVRIIVIVCACLAGHCCNSTRSCLWAWGNKVRFSIQCLREVRATRNWVRRESCAQSLSVLQLDRVRKAKFESSEKPEHSVALFVRPFTRTQTKVHTIQVNLHLLYHLRNGVERQ